MATLDALTLSSHRLAADGYENALVDAFHRLAADGYENFAKSLVESTYALAIATPISISPTKTFLASTFVVASVPSVLAKVSVKM